MVARAVARLGPLDWRWKRASSARSLPTLATDIRFRSSMSKYPPLLRRPLPPRDALPFDKTSTENVSDLAALPKKEGDLISEPKTEDFSMTYTPSSLNGFPSCGVTVQRYDDPYFAEDNVRYHIPTAFTPDNFLQKPCVNPSPSDKKKIVLSRHNVNKILNLLEPKLLRHNQEKLHIIELSIDDIPLVLKRIPWRQQVLEMIAASRNYHISPELPIYPGAELNFEESAQYFESPDSESTMEEEEEEQVKPFELVIVRSIIAGGESLSLRGFFIHQLPDLTRLTFTLKYLNLSFNNFRVIPNEIYQFSCLEMLNLRDNPITEISPDIEKLTNLRIFNISFCIVSILPVGLFLLPHLQSLNVAYNKISFIPNDIRNLRELRFLNIEGNELGSLPCGLLELPLKHIRVYNNYMHPLFWEENIQNQPQHLTDLAALSFTKNNLHQHHFNVPEEIQHILNKSISTANSTSSSQTKVEDRVAWVCIFLIKYVTRKDSDINSV
ncbi:leucine-rich repeat-containing protein 63-like isoform X2 [Mobula hypostoma]|uniref:leucine-rich repeat-containing protein 63-like isoform X2 n=1 Tax=Mobula hypostoma TaxID=723540 RepID=UPI002FC3C703